MSTRVAIALRLLLAAVAGVVGAALFLACVSARHQAPPSLRLRTVRRSTEHGRAVVYFRLEGTAPRGISISTLEFVLGPAVQIQANSAHRAGVASSQSVLWGPSQSPPLGNWRRAREDFGVVAPTNASSWRLQARVNVGPGSFMDRLRSLREVWPVMRLNNSSLFRATKASWEWSAATPDLAVESETVTNTAPTLF